MGSFCTNCVATQQIIADGDPCRIFFIRDAGGFGAKITLTSSKGEQISVLGDNVVDVGIEERWTLLSGSIRGTYDDYGIFRLDPVDEDRARHFLTSVAASLYSVGGDDALENETFSTDVLGEMLEKGDIDGAWDKFMRASERGVLFSSSIHRDGPRQVKLAAMHESAYQGLLALARGDERNSPERLAARIAANLPENLKALQEREPPAGVSAADWYPHLLDTRMRDSGDRAWPRHAPLDSGFAEGVRAVYSAFVKDPGHPEAQARAEAALAPLFEDGAALRAMDDLYLKLEPSHYVGQDYSNDAGAAYARLVDNVSRSVTAQREALYGEDLYEEDLEDESGQAPGF